jgi:hypothetical protein
LRTSCSVGGVAVAAISLAFLAPEGSRRRTAAARHRRLACAMLLLSGRANTRCSVCRIDPGGAPGTEDFGSGPRLWERSVLHSSNPLHFVQVLLNWQPCWPSCGSGADGTNARHRKNGQKGLNYQASVQDNTRVQTRVTSIRARDSFSEWRGRRLRWATEGHEIVLEHALFRCGKRTWKS